MKTLFFVFNPHSGKGLVRNHLLRIINIFTQAGYLVTAYPTQKEKDAFEQVCAIEGMYDRIVCCGGDGTLNEVISALMTYKTEKPSLGYIPAGTTNDFATSVGIPKKMADAAKIAAGSNRFQCDVGTFNGRIFNYVAAFGLLADTSYKTPQTAKNLLGHQAYVLDGFRSLQESKEYRVRVTTPEIQVKGTYIYGMIANSVYVGGYKGISGSDVKLDDGLFEVVLVKALSSPTQMHEILQALLWQTETPLIERFKASKIVIESKTPIEWSLDGEFGGEIGGDGEKIAIEVIPRAITLCAGDPALPGPAEA